MTEQSNLDTNKRMVRAFIDVAFNRHQADKAADYMTADIKWHGGTLGIVQGRDNFAGLVGAIDRAGLALTAAVRQQRNPAAEPPRPPAGGQATSGTGSAPGAAAEVGIKE